MTHPRAVLFLAHVFKGNEAFRAARDAGWAPLLLTRGDLLGQPWDRGALADVYAVPSLEDRRVVRAVAAHLAGQWPVRRVATVDDPGVDLAAHLREHLTLPGMTESAARRFRDKLNMRVRAADRGVRVPAFTSLFSNADIGAFTRGVPAPWVLKPRSEASSRGVRKISDATALARELGELGDARGDHLLERFVEGPLFHVDAVSSNGRVLFAEAHAYERPLLDVVRTGGIMVTRTVPVDSPLGSRLAAENAHVLDALGLEGGVSHTEFLLDEDGEFVFVESAARVGGAHIPELVEAASGVRLWDEYVTIELSERGEGHSVEVARDVPTALIVGLARAETPSYARFDGPEIVWRLHAPWQAGIILQHEDSDALDRLVALHRTRFVEELARPPTGSS